MLDRLELICKEAIGTPEKKMHMGAKLMLIGGILITLGNVIPYFVK